MATYAIGDIQGSFEPFQQLLGRFRFDADRDRLWLVGDLVNRGPDSLKTLRFVRALGECAVCVLGNHDLHLISVAAGCARLRADDTLDEVLQAPDCDDLIDWLRHRPMMHRQDEYALVHAGLLPDWSVDQALALAEEVEHALRAADYRQLLSSMYGNQPDRWDAQLTGFARLRVIVNAMTRMRVCSVDGRMDLRFKGEAEDAPAGMFPWFDVPGRASRDTPIVFGHWSALGLVLRPDAIGLDTGCLWGRRLSALRLQDRCLFQVSCAEAATPGPEQ
jgi:bis(5'-nucleosyl)-tetraphosphatase (symmetrical)